MPYIVMRRTDIPNGVLQVVDLKPNTSQRNIPYEPGMGQTGYIRNIPTSDTVATTGAGPIVTNAQYCGLAAYLIDHVEDSSTTAITAAVANTAAATIIARPQAGLTVTLANINAALVAAGATVGTGLTAGNSTGSLADVLSILQGKGYCLPGGAQVEDAGNLFDPTVSGYFSDSEVIRTYYDTGYFKISFGEGNLSSLLSSTFTYEGSAGAAITVYNNDGTLYVG